jgi:hypothetical protein
MVLITKWNTNMPANSHIFKSNANDAISNMSCIHFKLIQAGEESAKVNGGNGIVFICLITV